MYLVESKTNIGNINTFFNVHGFSVKYLERSRVEVLFFPKNEAIFKFANVLLSLLLFFVFSKFDSIAFLSPKDDRTDMARGERGGVVVASELELGIL